MSNIMNIMNNHKSDAKVPTREAPPPPTNGRTSWPSSIFMSKDRNGFARCTAVKKTAPPRPPPPKLGGSRNTPKLNCGTASEIWSSDCLIDWSSPPSSPSSVSKSNSDAISVNSFGSDSVNASSGSTSNVESGFEDEFDSFRTSSSKPFDPWSPIPVVAKSKQIAANAFVASKLAMPTIIRAKPERPKIPKILEKKYEMNALSEVFENSRLHRWEVLDEDEGWNSDSPPMPSCPPPPPPSQVLADQFDGCTKESDDDDRTAVAMYDYQGVEGDLSFKQGDRLRIIRYIDSNWLEASLDGRIGTAPVNHLQCKGSRDPNSRMATALYEFKAETWEDLNLQQGDTVTLLHRINAEWLYGQVGDRKGQFPASFVDHVPVDLKYSNASIL